MKLTRTARAAGRRPARSRALLTTAAVTAAALLLAACGGGSSGSSSSTGPTKLTFQASWVNDAEFTGYFVGLDKGYYTKAGLDVDYVKGGPNVIPESTLISNKADIALTSPDTTINAIVDQDAPLVIVGTQYQRNPLGVVSLTSSGIKSPADLVGRTVAVPDVNKLAFEAMLKINKVDPKAVKVVPYAYDPTPLIKGEVDATVDFTTNVPFTIEQAGQKASSFLMYDYGYKIPNDTVVVTKDFLAEHRAEVKAFLQASQEGWTENLKDPTVYPPTFMSSYFKGNGRTEANEVYFNKAQKPLIESDAGIFSMTPQTVQETIDTLGLVGIKATPAMFDTTLLSD
ncbi:ABC transporter substrate-binding protein [Spongisporangium articulatum]|uniref:Thiamine pyrimidine synthase n=1 Tax=Spongisporangium articulatum TaxID=3362603 RepID=A0ABW8AKH7_9ACTN